VNRALPVRLRPVFDVAIPGLYAWLVTVVVPIQQKDAHGWPVALSWIGICSLAASSMVVRSRYRMWSAIPVSLFVTSSAAVWFLVAPLEASMGIWGSIGWASFAIGWVRAAETGEPTDIAAIRQIDLVPRHRLSGWSEVMFGLGAVGSLLILTLAWQIEGRERSLLGHGMAAAAVLSLMTVATSGTSIGRRQAAVRSFPKQLLWRTLGLVSLLVFGVWLTFVRM
jgi:hypothetical protein